MKLNKFLLMAALGLSIVTVRAQEPPKGWDGCIGGDVVENFIKHDLDDADSFKYADSTDAPLWIAPVSETAYHLITVRYRAKNRFGAYQLYTAQINWKNGKILTDQELREQNEILVGQHARLEREAAEEKQRIEDQRIADQQIKQDAEDLRIKRITEETESVRKSNSTLIRFLLKNPPLPAGIRNKAAEAHIAGGVTVTIVIQKGVIVSVVASGPTLLADFAGPWVKANWKFIPSTNTTFTNIMLQ